MNLKTFLLLLCVLGAFSCENEENRADIEFVLELVKIDSLQVDYLGEINSGEFANGKGLLHNNQSGEFILIDTTGKILTQKTIPQEGPGSLSWVGGMKMFPSGEVYVNTLVGEIGVIGQDLNLKRKIEMPFPPELRDMANNAKILDLWEDQLIIYYPGRDGISPYIPHFFKNHYLLEKVSLSTGEAVPFLKLAPTSKHHSDFHFERPFVLISRQDNVLYHVLNNEPLIHLHDLKKEGEWMESLDIQPARFVQYEGQDKPVGYISGKIMSAGRISGIFPFEQGITVYYSEGIDQETFVNNELNLRKNLPLYPFFDRKILKVFQHEIGWSNEIEVPKEIKLILNIGSPEKDFYAVRNDDILGEEKDFLTVYRMRLVKK